MSQPRSVATLMLSLGLVLCIHAQNSYYWADGQRMVLTTSSTNFIVHSSDDLGLRALADNATPNKRVESFPHKGFATVRMPSAATKMEVLALLGLNPALASVSPGFEYADGYTVFPTKQLVFRTERKEDIRAIRQFLGPVLSNRLTRKYDIYRLELSSADSTLSLANQLYEKQLVAWAQPDFYGKIKRYANDPFYPDQFQLNNTGQLVDGIPGTPDMDCNAAEAWNITLGSATVTVAILDDGLEDHEDLMTADSVSRYIGGYSPATGGNGKHEEDGYHGTASAGIIGASHNDLGIRGVAPLVKFLSVNLFRGGETTQDLADGIYWAVNEGADVLNNSWGYNSCEVSFDNLRDALNGAGNNGRAGYGAVVVFASGNGFKNCVDFPANLNSVISVGAFTNRGVRASYSNYGGALDLVAASSGGGGVRSTDRMGQPGFSNRDYTEEFGGTSAACPVVSGVAALLLGFDPTLTSGRLKDILYATATDMGRVGKDDEYGHGRVNALAALQAANGADPNCEDNFQNGAETGVDCGGPDCPACLDGCNGTEVTINITLDDYPQETSWSLLSDTGTVIARGGNYGNLPRRSTVRETLCLPTGCYRFTINDRYGDGLCCSFGNGSYTVYYDNFTVASGARFGSEEVTEFCVAGSLVDTVPPTPPTNLVAEDITSVSTGLRWSPSIDRWAVVGYNIYEYGNLVTTVIDTTATIYDLFPETTYEFTVAGIDQAGNIGDPDTVYLTTLAEDTGSALVFGSYFEEGWDGWEDGGSDCYRYEGERSPEGNFSIRLRDGSGIQSATTSPSIDLRAFVTAEIEFSFFASSMEAGESLVLRYNDGEGWQDVATYVSGEDFENDRVYTVTKLLPAPAFNLSGNARFRLECRASSNADQVYIDAFEVTGTFRASDQQDGLRATETPTTYDRISSGTVETEVLLSPNPASHTLTVEAGESIEKISVYDLQGRLLQRKSYAGGNVATVDVRSWPAGVYLLRVGTEEEVVTERVVIQHR